MLDAFKISVELIGALRPVLAELRLRDPDLANQLTRAAASIGLNIVEGRKRVGRDQLDLYRVAAGSCEEVRAALMIATAWGHLTAIDLGPTEQLLDREAATLYRLVHPRKV